MGKLTTPQVRRCHSWLRRRRIQTASNPRWPGARWEQMPVSRQATTNVLRCGASINTQRSVRRQMASGLSWPPFKR